jgi:exopolyphosphatase/guanosine-5'-triphosphate,3'-diphosphate pyrophosphatase
MRRVGAIDIGTNTTRLLVAEIGEQGELRELDRQTAITRLGEGVDAHGRLREDAVARVRASLDAYRRRARELEAERVLAVATSAVRDAENGYEFLRAIAADFELEARLVRGEEEALLAFRGATLGRSLERPLLVVDIGGGSTELVVGDAEGPSFHVSLDVGAVRLTERFLHGDPPGPREIGQAERETRELIGARLPREVLGRPVAAIGNAGTITTLAALAQRLERYDRACVHGYRIARGEVERQLGWLASLPLAKRRRIPAMEPERAPVIVGGILVLREVLDAFALDSIEASELDILDGIALLAAGLAPEPG